MRLSCSYVPSQIIPKSRVVHHADKQILKRHILSYPKIPPGGGGGGRGGSPGPWINMYYYYYYWSLLYSAILRFRAVSLRSHVILHEWIALYIARFWISTEVVYLQRWRHGWCHMKLLPSRRVLCTPYNHAPCHFMQSHICKVYACLAVTCQLHFWRNDRGLLRATATITRGWNGYRNKCTSVLEMWGLLYALSESLNLSCLCLTNFMPRRKWLLLVRKSTYVGSDLNGK